MDKSNDMTGFLDGRMLIAMPGMLDPRFDRSVIFMCAHSDDGAMGLIVNKPAPDLKFVDLLEQLDIPKQDSAREIRVHMGGPVEHGRGFVLHSADYEAEGSTLDVSDDLGMTATIDILQDLAAGRGPDRALLALGYAGWGPGQLEEEISANVWLTLPASVDVLFNPDWQGKYQAAAQTLGIDMRLMATRPGHA